MPNVLTIIVGWWNRETGELVDIPGFDAVPTADHGIWLPVMVQVESHEALAVALRAWRT